jgi:3-isopropylmalate/(R)-2-methylmalate dehydratase large subunit
VRAPNRTLAVADHNIPTTDRSVGIEDEESRIQVEALEKNAADFGVPYFAMDDIRQGIVHVIGPEQGFTLPGMTIVCGDSHTATHGAFGALAFGLERLRLNMFWQRRRSFKSQPKTCASPLMAPLPTA